MMMRALAEYIMRGRLQAVTIALLGSWVPLLNQAALGLVTLRKGSGEGVLITLWALLPALAAAWLGDVGTAMVVASVAVLLLSYAAALILRITISWAFAMACVVAASATLAVLIAWWVGDIDVQLNTFFSAFLLSDADQPVASPRVQWSVVSATGAVGFWIGLSVLAGLLISRWWQALLYNPGGFGAEFRELRLPMGIALASLAGLLYCVGRGVEYAFWSSLLGLPLFIAGIALIHHIAKAYRLHVGWVALFYVALVLFKPLSLLMSLVAVIDAGFDLRKRINLTP